MINILKNIDINNEDVLLFVLIMVSDDTVMFGTASNTIFKAIRYVIIIFLCFLLYKKYLKINRLTKISIAPLLTMSSLVLLTGIYFMDLRSGYFYKINLLFVAFLYASITPINFFIQKFTRIIYFIGVFSLGAWLVMLLVPQIISIFPVLTNTADTKFHNLVFACVPFAEHGNRLYGPFREPGVSQMFFNLALIFHIATSKQLNFKIFLCLVACIALTLSTTGYIVLACVLVFLLFQKSDNQQYNKSKFIICFLTLIGIIVIYYTTDLLSAEGDVFNKFENTQRHSTVARLGSIFCNYQIFKMYPLFGAGFDNMGTLFPKLCFDNYGIYNTCNTNMILIQFATHGLLYGLLFLVGSLLFFQKLSTQFFPLLALSCAYICMCAGEDLTWSVMLYILMFYGFSKTSKFINT